MEIGISRGEDLATGEALMETEPSKLVLQETNQFLETILVLYSLVYIDQQLENGTLRLRTMLIGVLVVGVHLSNAVHLEISPLHMISSEKAKRESQCGDLQMAPGTSKAQAQLTGELQVKTFGSRLEGMEMSQLPKITLMKDSKELLCGDHRMVTGISKVTDYSPGTTAQTTSHSKWELEVIFLFQVSTSTMVKSNMPYGDHLTVTGTLRVREIKTGLIHMETLWSNAV